MNEEVPGVSVPDKFIKRMEAAGDKADEEGVQIALELIEAIKSRYIQPGASGGIRGFHLMAVGWEEIVPRIVTEGGLLPEGFLCLPPHPTGSLRSPPRAIWWRQLQLQLQLDNSSFNHQFLTRSGTGELLKKLGVYGSRGRVTPPLGCLKHLNFYCLDCNFSLIRGEFEVCERA